MNKLDKTHADLIDDAYKRYSITAGMTGQVESLTQEEYVTKIKTDDEFAKKWGIIIETRELSLKERLVLLELENIENILQELPNEGEKGSEEYLDFCKGRCDEKNISTKLITITYKNETIESYE